MHTLTVYYILLANAQSYKYHELAILQFPLSLTTHEFLLLRNYLFCDMSYIIAGRRVANEHVGIRWSNPFYTDL